MPRSDQIKAKQDQTRDLAVLHHTRYLAQLPDVDTNDAEDVAKRVTDYLDACEIYSVKPTMANLCLSLHISRQTLAKWLAGAIVKPRPVVEILSQAVGFINGVMESYMMEGLANPLATMFLMKNNHGYKDSSEQVVVRTESAGVDIKKLEEKYKASLPEFIDADFREVKEKELVTAAADEDSGRDAREEQ